MDGYLSESCSNKFHQFDEIWQLVLSWLSFRQSFYSLLLRESGELRAFDERSACIRLHLFSGSRQLSLSRRRLEYSVTEAFRNTFYYRFNRPLTSEFKVVIELQKLNYQCFLFHYHPLKIDDLLPFLLPSVKLSERRNLPNSPAVYFVLEDDNAQNSNVIYVGMTVNIANRWRKHERLKLLKPRSSNIRITWLECNNNAVRVMVEHLFIQLLEPELNLNLGDERISNWEKLGYNNQITLGEISNFLWIRGWDYGAIKQIELRLQNSHKIAQNQKLFVALLKYLISDPGQINHQFTPMTIPEHWMPQKNDIVLWVRGAQQLPCRIERVRPITGNKRLKASVNNCECEVIEIVANPVSLHFRDKDSFYVPLSELRPAQGLGLSILK